MSPRARYGVVCAFVTGFATAYLVSGLADVPLPMYDPRHGQWRFGVFGDPVEIRYYGQYLLGLLGGALLAPLGALGARRLPAGEPLGALWAMTATVLAAILFVVANWP